MNKNISQVQFNHLNLPYQISFAGIGANSSGTGNIYYSYDAEGNKLYKKVVDASAAQQVNTITQYVGSFVYEGKANASDPSAFNLQFFAHEDGRVRYIAATATK